MEDYAVDDLMAGKEEEKRGKYKMNLSYNVSRVYDITVRKYMNATITL